MFTRRKATMPYSLSTPSGKVLLLIDWDNVFFCLYSMFKRDIRLEYRLKRLTDWIKKEIGEIFSDHGFVFAPEHLAQFHQQVCVQNDLKLIICPKREIKDSEGKTEREEDTVDETIIWFGKMMMSHPDVKFICLVSGDDDYVPLFEEAEKHNIKRVLAPPTIDSLSKSKRLVGLVDKHPVTSKKMLLRLDTL